MENFEATNSTTVSAEAGVENGGYSREAVAEAAMEQALVMLDEKLPGVMQLPTAEKVPVLTIEGTDIPLHNEHRDVVESLARLLRVEESRLEFESVLAQHPELA
ncbi:MAG: hypothetical protein UW75_C0032G0003 [Parcubacteria group bacterium GW2011_GWF2_44_8]|nr:MAG: hypothetical protein UW75_C0032G0003 [Parcubacteria group bacterium GW2011_GWF2_44_8]